MLEALAAPAKYIAVMLLGAMLGRRGLRVPQLGVTLVTAALVYIVAWSVAPAILSSTLEVITVSILYAAASALGSLLAAYPLGRLSGQEAARPDQSFTVIVASGLAAGIATGVAAGPAPTWLIDPLLVALVLLAGVELGRHPVKLEAQTLLVPLASLAGSLAAALPVYLATRVTLAVAAGMGWYTFTGPYLYAATGDARIAAIGFLANLLREQAAIILVPVAARRIPLPAAVAVGGVTTMDTTLPAYATAYGPRGTITAAANGALLTLLVPVLVPLVYALAP